jgi:parallel beta-helix repeat protein
VIDNYQKNGVDVRYAGSSAEIAHNRILGIGPTSTLAQNGIVVLGDAALGSATATIRHNFVANNIYTILGTEATGILPFQSGTVITEYNTVTSNNVDIYMFQADAGSTTTNNDVRASSDDGIVVNGSDNVRVANNKSESNGGAGIGMYDATTNAVDDNHVEDNAQSGILLDNADMNTVSDNKVRDNGTAGADVVDGIRAEATSTGNTIQKNQLRDNLFHDCHDASLGPANTWTGNHAETSFPLGLCAGPGADATAFETSTVYGWDPDYPWYDGLGLVADYDWAAAYATIDTESLLQLLPTVGVGGIRPASPNP